MVDYMIWPWFGYFPALRESGFVLNADGKLPKLAAWIEAMQKDPAVQKIAIPEDTLQRYMATVKQGETDYDIE